MKRRKNGSKWYKLLFVALVGFSFALVAINIVSLVVIPLMSDTRPDYEETAIQNIISIFGIAVSVWIGLSIVDRMDRGEILKLKEQAEAIEAQLAENERVNLQLLLDDLQGNTRYDIAQFLVQKIKEIDVNTFSSGVWSAMRQAEQLLNKLTNSKSRLDSEMTYSQYIGCIENIRKMIKKNKNSSAVKSLNEILDFRMIRARFEMGYSTDSITANKYFIECISFFAEKSCQFGLELSAIPDKCFLDEEGAKGILDSCLRKQKYEWNVYAYLFNFLGDSYSEIVYYNNKCDEKKRTFPKGIDHEKCKKLAVNYCLLSVVSARRGEPQCETYFRNYGCAIERVNFGGLTEAILWKAVEQYKQAFKINTGHRSVYYCLTSAYNKIFEVRTGLYRRDKSKKRTEIHIKQHEEQKMKAFFCEYRRWITLYLKCFPQEVGAHRMAALFYRDVYLWNGDILSARCLGEQLCILKQMRPEIEKEDVYKDGMLICSKMKNC